MHKNLFLHSNLSLSKSENSCKNKSVNCSKNSRGGRKKRKFQQCFVSKKFHLELLLSKSAICCKNSRGGQKKRGFSAFFSDFDRVSSQKKLLFELILSKSAICCKNSRGRPKKVNFRVFFIFSKSFLFKNFNSKVYGPKISL